MEKYYITTSILLHYNISCQLLTSRNCYAGVYLQMPGLVLLSYGITYDNNTSSYLLNFYQSYGFSDYVFSTKAFTEDYAFQVLCRIPIVRTGGAFYS